jgi:hypothetical protein
MLVWQKALELAVYDFDTGAADRPVVTQANIFMRLETSRDQQTEKNYIFFS